MNAETVELIRFLGLEGIENIQSGELSCRNGWSISGLLSGSKPQVLLLENRSPASQPPNANVFRILSKALL